MLSSRLLALGCVMICITRAALAQTVVTWGNTGTDFTLGLSWVGGTAPASSHIAEFSSSGTILIQPVLSTNHALTGLRFAAGAGSFTLSGTGTLSLGSSGLSNQSSAAQTVAVALSFGTTAPTIVNAGTLTLSGTITNNAIPLGMSVTNDGTMTISGSFVNNGAMGVTFGGTGTNGTVSGVISGASSVRKSGTGRWVFSGANTYTGGTTLSGGVLSISSDGNLGAAPTSATPGSLTFSAGVLSTLETTSTFTLSANRGIAVAGSANLSPASGTTLSYGGVMSGSGTLFKSGAGTLVLSGANTYTGGTQISEGTVQLGASGVLPTAGVVAIEPAFGVTGTLDLNGNTQTVSSLTLGGGGPGATALVTIGTGGTLTLAGNVQFLAANQPGGAIISGGTLALGGTRMFTVGDSSARTADLTVSSVIADGGVSSGVVKTGEGTLVLSGANTFSGGLVVNDGSVQLGANDTLRSTTNVTVNGLTAGRLTSLDLDGHTQTIGTLTFGGVGATSSSTNKVLLNSGTLTLGGDVTYNATNNPLGAWIMDGTLQLGGTRTFNIGRSTNAFPDLSITAAIAGAGFGLVKTGPGALELSGANTYTGATVVHEGRVQIGFGGSLPSGAEVVVNSQAAGRSATFDIGNASVSVGNLTFGGAGATSTSTNMVTSGGGALTLTGTVTYDPANNPSGAMISGGTLVLSGARTFAVGDSTNAAVDLLVFPSISGTGGLTKTGAGTLMLNSGSSTYTGRTSLEAGTLLVMQLADAGMTSSIGAPTGANATIALGSGANSATLRYVGFGPGSTNRSIDLAGTTGGATLDVSGSGGVTFAGNIISSGAGAKTLTLAGAGTTVNTISGAIADNSSTNTTSVLKTGFGTWSLAGPNTYTGGTTVASGTLRLGANNALPANGPVTVNAVAGLAALDFNGMQQSNPIGPLVFGGTGAGVFASNKVILGTGGLLTLGAGVTYDATNNPLGAYIARTSPFDFANPYGGTLALGAATRRFEIGDSSRATAELTIFSTISGGTGVGLEKTGAGTLVLAGNNTYQGTTTVSAGTLLVASNSAVGTGPLVVQSGATLAPTPISTPTVNFSSDVTLANAVTLANNVTLGSSHTHSDQRLLLAGVVTAGAANTTIHLGGDTPVVLSGTLTGASAGTAITFDSGSPSDFGVVALSGTTSGNIASILANNAAVIFSTPAAISSTATVQASNGYVGVGVFNAATVPSANALLARITDKAGFAGTFGFDTDFGSLKSAFNYSQAVDFSGFGANANFTIGSASAAILSGAITPSTAGYVFGNGGGMLAVASNLTDVGGTSRAVSITSTLTARDNALTVAFQGNNTYTGNLAVANSIGVLDSPFALPSAGKFSLGQNGYLGYTEAFTAGTSHHPMTFGDFVSRLTSYQPTSVLGLDSTAAIADYLGLGGGTAGSKAGLHSAGRFVTETLDLSNLGSIYLGTTTYAVLAGPVKAPNQAGANRTLSLIGARGGYLNVESSLLAGNVSQVVVGTSQAPLAGGTVRLAGENTYAGGTKLMGGRLIVSGNSTMAGTAIASGPLGTGPLTVESGAARATLANDDFIGDTVLHNAIRLGSALQLGFASFDEIAGNAAASTASSGLSRLVLNGVITDLDTTNRGSLDVFSNDAFSAEYSQTVLNGANTFSGGVNLYGGSLVLGHDSALGTGTLRIEPRPFGFSGPFVALQVSNGPRTIANPIILDLFGVALPITGSRSLTIAGSVQMNSNVTLAPENHPLFVSGAVTGSGRLIANSLQPIWLQGTNTYTGGTQAGLIAGAPTAAAAPATIGGTIIFGSVASIPASPTSALTAGFDGYIGLATPTTALQSSFIDRFNKPATVGTIGFDTSPGNSTPNTFTGAINLRNFDSSARLGSATRAVLDSGTVITPQGNTYTFGGGGGLLEVNAPLGDQDASTRGLFVHSSSTAPLTLRLGGTHTFTGPISVFDSGLIFKSGALPGGTAGTNTVFAANAYVGTEDSSFATSPAAFLNRFNAFSSGTIVGFDSFTGTPYTLSGAIDLSARFSSSSDNKIFLGTATAASITGAITLPTSQTTYRFAGYKGGQLTVSSTLSGARAVELGSKTDPATFGSLVDPAMALSSVTLSGANTHTAGTTLFAGLLRLGHDQALGTGTLTINADDFRDGVRAGLFATGGARTVTNALSLLSDVDIGGSLTLSGAISGTGEIYKVGSTTLTLSGNNSGFSGGIKVTEGNVTFASANAVGTGPVLLGGTPASSLMSAVATTAPSVTFAVSTTVNGIAGQNTQDRINFGNTATLTINQKFDATFAGAFATSGGSLVYQGPSTTAVKHLLLTGASSYTGSTTINGGIAVIAGNNSAFGDAANTVTLNGGKLGVLPGITIANDLRLTSGTLAGAGTVQPAATLTIGTGVTVSPGVATSGTLQFTDRAPSIGNVLTLASGGRYDWQVIDVLGTPGIGWDNIAVSGAVNITATAATPFSFRLTPLDVSGLLNYPSNFDPFQTYSWTVLSATTITGFTSGAQFMVDPTSPFLTLVPAGSFTFSLNSAGNALMVNFTLVPEPSTYVLMGMGVVVIAVAMRRRTRARRR